MFLYTVLDPRWNSCTSWIHPFIQCYTKLQLVLVNMVESGGKIHLGVFA